MALSFAGQTLIHREVPGALSICGAGFLLSGVALMACARKLYPASTKPTADFSTTMGIDNSSIQDECGPSASSRSSSFVEDDELSLGSFIASEFSGLSPLSAYEHSTARQRRTAGVVPLPGAQTIGAVSA